MREPQQIVDDIEALLQSDDLPDEQELQRLGAEYTEAVKSVNARLKQAWDLLRKGHRGEAMQMCEAEPNAFEAAEVLDFLDREAFIADVQDVGLPTPPAPEIELASELMAEGSVDQQLGQLMRRHRWLALARGPLQSRIDVMRKIARVDRDNPIWKDDLKEFERARHAELQGEFKTAVAKKDADALAVLEREVADPRWMLTPAKAFVKQIEQAHAKLRSEHARMELVKLEPQLTEAYSSLELDKGRRLRDRWNARAAIAELPHDDPLLDLAHPALAWLDEEDRKECHQAEFDAAVAELDRALDHEQVRLPELDRTCGEIARTYWQLTPAVGLDVGLDEVLGYALDGVRVQRLGEKIRTLHVEDKRRARLKLVGIVLAVTVAAVLIGFGIFWHLRSTAIATHVDNVTALMQQGNLSEARTYVDETVKPIDYVYNSASMQGLLGELSVAEKKDQDRLATRSTHLAAARQAGLDNAALGSFDKAYEELVEAHKLSRKGAEQNEILALEQEIRTREQQLLTQRDDVFRTKLETVKERMAALAPDDLSGIQQLHKEAQALDREQDVAQELKALARPLITQIAAMEDSERERRRQASKIGEIVKAVEDHGISPGSFERQLREFIQQFPGTSRTQSFEQVVNNEAALWNGLDKWNRLIRLWSGRNLAAARPQDARAWADEAGTLLNEHAEFPAADNVRKLVEHLEAVAARVDATGGKLHAGLQQPLSSQTVAKLYMLRTANGENYYSKDPPIDFGGKWQIRYLTDLSLTTVEVKSFERLDVVNGRRDGQIDWTSPQARFSNKALDALDKINEGNWDATFLDLLNDVYDDREMDPILKLQLMGVLLQTAGGGSLPIRTKFQSHMEAIQTAGVGGTVNWLDPVDRDVKDTRKVAESVLRRMSPPKTVAREVERELKLLERPVIGAQYEWLGLLLRDASRSWSVEVPTRLRSTAGDVDLYLVHRPADAAGATFQKVGQIRGGTVALDSAASSTFAEGRPVFARKGGN